MDSKNNSPKDHTIGPVSRQELEAAIEDKRLDSSTEILIEHEMEYIHNWRKRSKRENKSSNDNLNLNDLNGLALSGGGIRSATFSLGIMQALAHNNLLHKFDYLSTVSGGGYIGSAVTWLASDTANASEDHKFGLEKDDFPFGTDDPAPDAEQTAGFKQKKLLRFLRGHGNYLSPGKGINIISLMAVILRGTLLNLLVWLPVFALVFMLGIHVSKEYLNTDVILWHDSNIFSLQYLYERILPKGTDIARYASFELSYQIGIGFIGVLCIGMIAYSVMTWFRRSTINDIKKRWYKWRRSVEAVSSSFITLAVLALIISSLPIVAGYLGVIGMVSGIAMHLPSFIASVTSDKKVPMSAIVPMGAGLFLYGVFITAFQIADKYYGNTAVQTMLILVPLITGYFVNLNYISLHRFYRDRLMETFMPDIERALRNGTGASYGADSASIQEISNTESPRSPYHIVNTNVVLVNSEDPTYEDRGGDSFILSPLYCGSNSTGWKRTGNYMGGKMTLATAVAISGAAANPNTGVGGSGLTRNRILSLVMSLLNLRLGYWAHHPNNTPIGSNTNPNHIRPGGYSFLNAIPSVGGFKETRPYLQLSDGGHFENMAVYELVRRRLGVIVICDGGADPDFSFSDFQTTIRRIEDDFGARVVVDSGASPDQVLPTKPNMPAYPPGAKFSEKGYMTGEITYADNSTGILVYLKTAMIGNKKTGDELSFKVKGYKAQHASFPDESTADQFFDEVQFESYRELGFRVASQMIQEAKLDKILERHK